MLARDPVLPCDVLAGGGARSTNVHVVRVGAAIIMPATAAPASDVRATDAISVVLIVPRACLSLFCRHGTA